MALYIVSVAWISTDISYIYHIWISTDINDIDERVQSLEDDAHDINEGSKQKKSKKRKRKMDGPSKDVRVSFVYTLKCMVVKEYALYQ